MLSKIRMKIFRMNSATWRMQMQNCVYVFDEIPGVACIPAAFDSAFGFVAIETCNALDTNVGKTKSQNTNYSRNIFCFVVFKGFYFFVARENFVFGVFIFCDFAFFFGTGAARRKIQNHKKWKHQKQNLRELQKK